MTLQRLNLYTCFHLNLAYSSIEVEDRAKVVEKCYRPLLDIIAKLGFRCGIEASAYTLEEIREYDPIWIEDIKTLISSGVCEFIASGYCQSIGPLMPAEANAANFAIGNRRYSEIINTIPQVVLVNEQAFSSGMIAHYLDAGYKAMVMEWNNPALTNREWQSEWRYHPQFAVDQQGRKIPVIWNNSIFFQKFQHYSHGEKELEEYLGYIASHQAPAIRFFPLYGNDVEIFDFRPGRYHTEAQLGAESEWKRIERLFKRLKDDERFIIISPSDSLKFMDMPDAGNELALETAAIPVPVKKQEKYNITRWAVTGRDDLGINSSCKKIYKSLKHGVNRDPEAWRELCYLWSSDFRTHITEKRWSEYQLRLKSAENRYCQTCEIKEIQPLETDQFPDDVLVSSEGRLLKVETRHLMVVLNKRRGLVIDGLWTKGETGEKLCGTLPHGYYDDITLGADFYSGHLIFESPGKPKLTDLEKIDPVIKWDKNSKAASVSFVMQTSLGDLKKQIRVYAEVNTIEYIYELHWNSLPVGSLRLGHITLNPEAFDKSTLFFRTHNGGREMETFSVGGQSINHGEHASFLVSAKHALGMTEGVLEVGDADKFMRISLGDSSPALLAMIKYVSIKDTYFLRCSFSAREMDETSRQTLLNAPLIFKISVNCHSLKEC
ncbi:glycoside hydrolase family 57 [Geobacter pelophilus]|uniref:Glycoside hydrolase family 57 n=1 Tax=Geoanaerobacter pelophilus TaxID=60036 RepID=A0AAW4KYT6_9BACT|nr:glycoside hydrolase family 57 [Geoanaerobacter pelophilus]MBT0663919.1 glycoside hydrolase family 57 [Geoanaerobacter pelophilus]